MAAPRLTAYRAGRVVGTPLLALKKSWHHLTTPRAHWLGNILQILRTHIVEQQVYLPPNLPLRIIGDADAAWLSDSLKTRCNVDAITEDIVVIDDNVSDVYSDADFIPHFLRHGDDLLSHPGLNHSSASRCVDSTGELDEHTVPSRLHDTPAVGGDGRINPCFSDRLELGQRAFLVDPHETAIPGHIRGEYRCQSPLHALLSQNAPWVVNAPIKPW